MSARVPYLDRLAQRASGPASLLPPRQSAAGDTWPVRPPDDGDSTRRHAEDATSSSLPGPLDPDYHEEPPGPPGITSRGENTGEDQANVASGAAAAPAQDMADLADTVPARPPVLPPGRAPKAPLASYRAALPQTERTPTTTPTDTSTPPAPPGSPQTPADTTRTPATAPNNTSTAPTAPGSSPWPSVSPPTHIAPQSPLASHHAAPPQTERTPTTTPTDTSTPPAPPGSPQTPADTTPGRLSLGTPVESPAAAGPAPGTGNTSRRPVTAPRLALAASAEPEPAGTARLNQDPPREETSVPALPGLPGAVGPWRSREPTAVRDLLPPAAPAPQSTETSGPGPRGSRQDPHGSARARVSIGTIEVTVVPPARPVLPADRIQPAAEAPRGRPRFPSASTESADAGRLRDGLRRWYGTAQG
jgi:hypothetical protein